MKKPSYSVYDVFTPTTQARLNFVPRQAVNDQLVDALKTPGKQLIVYGESGCGKSTLLLNKLSETHSGHITTQCSTATTYASLILDAFDQLDPYYLQEKSTHRNRNVSPSLAAQFAVVKAELKAGFSTEATDTVFRALPPQLTAQRLAQFLGAQGMCWVIEDFHKMQAREKLPFSQSLKIFCDVSAQYSEVKTICIGATETARQVVEYDSEMRSRVAELLVPLMTEDELSQIILNGQSLLNVDLADLVNNIVQYSVGVPSVCHQLSLNACLERGINATQAKLEKLTADEDLKAAVEHYVRDSSDTLKAAFDRALKRHKVRKFDNCRLILEAMAKGPLEGMLYAQILASIRAISPDYPPGNLTLYLSQLTSGERGNILKSGTDGKYRFADPLYHTFAQLTLVKPSQSGRSWKWATPVSEWAANSLDQLIISLPANDHATSVHSWIITSKIFNSGINPEAEE